MRFRNRHSRRSRVLFVWDGTNDYIAAANLRLARIGNAEAVAVQAVPNAAVYGNTLKVDNDPTYVTTILKTGYELAVRHSPYLRNTRLHLLVGDRIELIANFASVNGIDLVLLPPFEQSAFSKWIHGDLNARISNELTCPVQMLKKSSNERFSQSKTLKGS